MFSDFCVFVVCRWVVRLLWLLLAGEEGVDERRKRRRQVFFLVALFLDKSAPRLFHSRFFFSSSLHKSTRQILCTLCT